nr:MAG TPA: hypothetical protein [Caudoviricetes sp.]
MKQLIDTEKSHLVLEVSRCLYHNFIISLFYSKIRI